MITMEAWGTHLITFLVGVSMGACGKYFADKYTDERRKKEKKQEEINNIREIQKTMPELIEEMKQDFNRPEYKTGRELVVMPSRNVPFNSGGVKYFYYFETEHEDLISKISILENHGYLVDVTPVNVPIFRISEKFWELIQKL